MTGNFKPAVPVYSAERLYTAVVANDADFKAAVLTLATETTITDKVYNSSTYAGVVKAINPDNEEAATITTKTRPVSASLGADFVTDFDNFTKGINGFDDQFMERNISDNWTASRDTDKNAYNANFRAKAVANGDSFNLSIKEDKMVLSNFKQVGTATIVDTWANKSPIFS